MSVCCADGSLRARGGHAPPWAMQAGRRAADIDTVLTRDYPEAAMRKKLSKGLAKAAEGVASMQESAAEAIASPRPEGGFGDVGFEEENSFCFREGWVLKRTEWCSAPWSQFLASASTAAAALAMHAESDCRSQEEGVED